MSAVPNVIPNELLLSLQTLEKQNAETSNSIIHLLNSNESFLALSQFEGDAILKRDNEDDVKLAQGVLSLDILYFFTVINE